MRQFALLGFIVVAVSACEPLEVPVPVPVIANDEIETDGGKLIAVKEVEPSEEEEGAESSAEATAVGAGSP